MNDHKDSSEADRARINDRLYDVLFRWNSLPQEERCDLVDLTRMLVAASVRRAY